MVGHSFGCSQRENNLRKRDWAAAVNRMMMLLMMMCKHIILAIASAAPAHCNYDFDGTITMLLALTVLHCDDVLPYPPSTPTRIDGTDKQKRAA